MKIVETTFEIFVCVQCRQTDRQVGLINLWQEEAAGRPRQSVLGMTRTYTYIATTHLLRKIVKRRRTHLLFFYLLFIQKTRSLSLFVYTGQAGMVGSLTNALPPKIIGTYQAGYLDIRTHFAIPSQPAINIF